MSRTYRRVNKTHEYSWVLREWEWVGDREWLKATIIDPRSEEGRRRLANFHSDAGCGSYKDCGAPHWYCNRRERTRRMEARAELFRFMQRPDTYEVMLLGNHRHSAGWDWW